MKNINKKGFTLLEVLVTLIILSILIVIWNWFLYSIKQNSIKKLISADVDSINDYISLNPKSDYYTSSSEDIDDLILLNNLSKNDLTDIYYSVDVISPVLVNNFDNPLIELLITEVGDTNNAYIDIVLWLQSCKYLFDINWNTIKWKNYIKKCEDPINWWDSINLQWFILFNWEKHVIEKNNYYYNLNWFFWYNFNIVQNNLELYNNWIKSSLINLKNFYIYDLLYDDPIWLYKNKFFIYSLKMLNWNIEQGIYKWTENNFTNLIKNKYITWINNNTVLDILDIKTDKIERQNLLIKNYNSLQLLYNNPSNYKNSYEEILYIWLTDNEKN